MYFFLIIALLMIWKTHQKKTKNWYYIFIAIIAMLLQLLYCIFLVIIAIVAGIFIAIIVFSYFWIFGRSIGQLFKKWICRIYSPRNYIATYEIQFHGNNWIFFFNQHLNLIFQNNWKISKSWNIMGFYCPKKYYAFWNFRQILICILYSQYVCS